MSSKAKSSAVAGGGVALVPKRRFPEFRGAGPWETAPGNELFQQVNNREAPPGLPILAITQEHGAIPRHMIDYHVSVTEKSLETYKEVRPGDFIISLRSFQGGIEFSEYHGICSPAYVILRKRGRLSDAFYRQHFKSHTFIQQLTRNLEGLRDGKMISYKQFSELQLLKPSPLEQQKIADCLDSADALIAAQGRKVEALKAHKKGLMQQLFPQEGETQPRLRFPEFEGTGEWSQTALGRLIEIKGRIGYRGYTVADIVGTGEGAIALSPSNISEDGSLRFEKATFITRDKYNESPEIMVERGQTLLVKTGSTYGKSAFVRDLPQECTVNPQIVVLKPISVDPFFLSLLVYGEGVQAKINSSVVGGAIPTLSQDSISKFKVLVPKISEQQRIANCLTSLDDLIAAESQKLDTFKTHKKGLMQQLFPMVDGVDA